MTYKVVGAYWSLMSQTFQHLVHIRCGRWSLRCDYFGTTMWALRKLSPHKRSWAMLQKLIFQVDLNLIGLSMICLMTVTIAAIPRSKTPNTFVWWKQVVSGRTKCHDPWKRIIVRQAFAASYLSLFEITVLSKASEAVCGSVVDKSKATDNVVLFFGLTS